MNEKKLDTELVAEFRNGNTDAYAEIINRYTQKVHNLALRITRNAEDAEEVLQDVFVTVYRKIDKFEGKSAFSSWLYRITANTAFMKLRKRKQTPAVSLEEVAQPIKENYVGDRSDTSDTTLMCSKHELRDEIERAVARLPEEYRIIFVLRDIDGLSNQEVGEILHLSVPAVKSRLHRSRLMLRRKLQKFYDDYCSDEDIAYGPTANSQRREDEPVAA